MTKEQIEAMMAKQKEASKSTPFLNTEMGQYAYQLGFEDGVDHALSHQWVSVEDEMPNDIPNCFVAYKAMDNVLYSTGSYEKDNDEWYVDGFGYNANVTHWMPIPPLAEEGGEK